MAEKLSRRKIADYAAEQLQAGNTKVLREIAAYLIESKRQNEADLLVRDIELQLANRGDMIARTVSAHEVDVKQLSNFVKQMTGAKTVHLKHTIDESLLGGVQINLPGQSLDSTIRRKLTALKSRG